MALLATVAPVEKEWLGVAREIGGAGVAVNPVASIPIDKIDVAENQAMIDDKSFRGDMAEDHNVTLGTRDGALDPSGNVYLDTIPYLLDNVLGDYSVTGSNPTSSTTLTAQANAGVTTATVASIVGYSNGSIVQIDTGANAEIVVLSIAPSGNTITFTNFPLRRVHASAAAVTVVSAPFTHIFSLLNSGNGQPATHTLTHYTGLPATYGARQYAAWCASEMQFTMDTSKNFDHTTKGLSIIGAIPSAPITNTQSNVTAEPSWMFQGGIGGPASGGTLSPNLISGEVTIARQVKPYYGLVNSQDPIAMARNGLAVTGKLVFLAKDDVPMTTYLAGTQQQIQLAMTNGLAGANLLSCTFNFQQAIYEPAKLTENEMFEHEASFRAIANTTDAGPSGGRSPLKVTVINAVPAY